MVMVLVAAAIALLYTVQCIHTYGVTIDMQDISMDLNIQDAASTSLLKPWWKSPSVLCRLSISWLCSFELSSHL